MDDGPGPRRTLIAALVVAVVAGIALAVIPWGSRETVSVGAPGTGETIQVEATRVTLLENEGAGVIPILLVPAVLAAFPLVVRGRRRPIATLLAAVGVTTLVVVGAASIGLFYLPAAVLLWVANAWLRRQVGDDPTRRSYDRIAECYAEEFSDELTRKPFDRDLLADLAARWSGKGPVLDVGCGPGHVTAHLASLGVDAAGVDLSPGMIEVARRRFPELRFEVADMRGLPIVDHQLAGVVALYSVIHIPPAEIPAVIAEFRRVLSEDGLLLVAGHAGEGSVSVRDFRGIEVDLAATWFDLEVLTSTIEDAGFEIEQAVQRPPFEGEGTTERIYVVARAAG